MSKHGQFIELGATLDQESHDWLLTESPALAAAVEAEVRAGAEPDEIKRFMTKHIGEHRAPLIARCVSAARWLKAAR